MRMKSSFETDRSKFIGREEPLQIPCNEWEQELSNSEGSVLDPIVSIRCTVTIDPGETARVNFVTGIAETKASALELIDKYHDPAGRSRLQSGLDSRSDDNAAAQHHRGGYTAISRDLPAL